MTRTRLLQLLIQQARADGFEFRKWFLPNCGLPWSGADDAVEWLARAERANLLLFSQVFAKHFWRSGQRVTFMVPAQAFQRVAADGSVKTVARKAHLRQSSREDVWKFHLREMAASAQPLRYIRRYLIVDEVLESLLAEQLPHLESLHGPHPDE
ncbi:MAG: hypothetical protein ACRYF4_07355 [Janthinobacterium lividum]